MIGTGVRTEQGYYPADQRWARRLLDALPGAVHAEIVGADAPVAQSSDKRRLHAQTGAMAVDMESHVAARVAATHNIPFAICRTVIDPAHRDLPPAAVVGLRHDGTPDMRAISRSGARAHRNRCVVCSGGLAPRPKVAGSSVRLPLLQ